MADLNDFFFYTREELLKELKGDMDFLDIHNKIGRLEKKFPIILELFEGRNMEKAVELTEKDRKAIWRYVELKREMQDEIELKYYYRGQRDFLLQLHRCGIFEERL